ncbi:MAG: sigma-54 factor interaction domain-containing protein [Ignavibacteriales bacterium]|nr:sigma-54 factor interaction domain-containing protein [Ignavibacteriales bacterium]
MPVSWREAATPCSSQARSARKTPGERDPPGEPLSERPPGYGQCVEHPETPVREPVFRPPEGVVHRGGKDCGFFEQAHGRTRFLDEIGELPLHLQPKLLRVIEEQTIARIEPIPLPARSWSGSFRPPTGISRMPAGEDLPARPAVSSQVGAHPSSAPARAPGRHPAPGGPFSPGVMCEA